MFTIDSNVITKAYHQPQLLARRSVLGVQGAYNDIVLFSGLAGVGSAILAVLVEFIHIAIGQNNYN